uniref:calcium-activated potassium channel subunit beta-3 n=1 Tax=Monopterus albus TaxID=43700 RepID=UPI0009B3CE6E|nr:calcium-activated potassium channel subunit beta-3-like [Monopterus albus]
MDVHEVHRARAQMTASSIGEDRAILLGYIMIAFSVLMFFVVGITVVKPYVNSNWQKEAGCVLVQTEILTDWVDCRSVTTVPCLRLTVNLTGSNQSAFLHFDEESVLLASECFYVPKCRMDRADLEAEVQKVKNTLDVWLGRTSSCLTDRMSYPKDVILGRKYTLRKALFALLWPCLMLSGGALLVGLVKLTQCLAVLSHEMCSESTGSRLTSRYTQGKLYRLLWRSSTQSSS